MTDWEKRIKPIKGNSIIGTDREHKNTLALSGERKKLDTVKVKNKFDVPVDTVKSISPVPVPVKSKSKSYDKPQKEKSGRAKKQRDIFDISKHREQAKQMADEIGISLNAVINLALYEYLKKN